MADPGEWWLVGPHSRPTAAMKGTGMSVNKEEISYFDPVVKEVVVGRDAVVAHVESIYSNPHIVRSEYLNPAVSVSDSGDFAVLAHNLDTYVLDDNGNEQQLRAWNATEAYRLIDGEWRIAHSHWAFPRTAEGAIAS
jgi:ketosteroid isomerase-like protein